jgi:hypothetical protein
MDQSTFEPYLIGRTGSDTLITAINDIHLKGSTVAELASHPVRRNPKHPLLSTVLTNFAAVLKIKFYIIKTLYNLSPLAQRAVLCKSIFKYAEPMPLLSDTGPYRQVIDGPGF